MSMMGLIMFCRRIKSHSVWSSLLDSIGEKEKIGKIIGKFCWFLLAPFGGFKGKWKAIYNTIAILVDPKTLMEFYLPHTHTTHGKIIFIAITAILVRNLVGLVGFIFIELLLENDCQFWFISKDAFIVC